MSLSVQTTPDEKTVTIAVDGRFDFNLHEEFRSAYEGIRNTSANYVIDLGSTEYMDSSALGMLLLLREYAGGERSRITIANAREEVKQILTISNFQKLFTIA